MKLPHAMALALNRHKLVVVIASGFKWRFATCEVGEADWVLYGVSIVQHDLAGRRVIVG